MNKSEIEDMILEDVEDELNEKHLMPTNSPRPPIGALVVSDCGTLYRYRGVIYSGSYHDRLAKMLADGVCPKCIHIFMKERMR